MQWAGATLQAPHRAMSAQRGIAPTGVYVAYFGYGSPATRYGLYPGRRIVEVDGVPTPDLDAFLKVVLGRPDRSSVRLKTITWNNAPEVITLKLDKHYWPAYELRARRGWLGTARPRMSRSRAPCSRPARRRCALRGPGNGRPPVAAAARRLMLSHNTRPAGAGGLIESVSSMARNVRASQVEIESAVQALRDGELVAFPTETVYGLGANAQNPAAVRKIFEAKGRPHDHPVIVHLDSPRYLHRWVREVPEARQPPGGELLAGAAHDGAAARGTRARRRSPAARTRSPSACPRTRWRSSCSPPSAAASPPRPPTATGGSRPTRAEHVREEFGETVRVILDGGECQIGLESTIVSFEGERVRLLRPGSVTAAQLRDIVGELHIGAGAESPRVPGGTPTHYAPSTPLTIVPAGEIDAQADAASAGGRRVAVLAQRLPLRSHKYRHLDQRRPARRSLRARAVHQPAHARQAPAASASWCRACPTARPGKRCATGCCAPRPASPRAMTASATLAVLPLNPRRCRRPRLHRSVRSPRTSAAWCASSAHRC